VMRCGGASVGLAYRTTGTWGAVGSTTDMKGRVT
jgi:hypothetical protein